MLAMPFFNPGMAVYMPIIVIGISLALRKCPASFVGHFVIRGSGIFDVGDTRGDVKHVGLFHIIPDEVRQRDDSLQIHPR
ncbi:MAG: hypothetical protein WBZ29_04455 [Methanocella sp.]